MKVKHGETSKRQDPWRIVWIGRIGVCLCFLVLGALRFSFFQDPLFSERRNGWPNGLPGRRDCYATFTELEQLILVD